MWCEPRREFLARDELERLGAAVFLPHERVKRRQRFRRHQFRLVDRDEPIFPRYLFADAPNPTPLLCARGIVDVLRSGVDRVPLAVPDPVIDALRAVAGEDGRIRSWDSTKLSTTLRLRVGDAVKLSGSAGPFAGLTAQISSVADLDRSGQVKVWLEMLGGKVDVSLDFKLLGKVVGKTSSPEQADRAAPVLARHTV